MLLKVIAWIFGLEIIIFVADRCGLIETFWPSRPREKLIMWVTILSVSAALLPIENIWVWTS